MESLDQFNGEFEGLAKHFKFQSKMSVRVLLTHHLLFAWELGKDKDEDMQLPE